MKRKKNFILMFYSILIYILYLFRFIKVNIIKNIANTGLSFWHRFCAITKPLKYGVKRTPRRMIVYVSLVWLGAACISLPPLLIMGNEHTYSETGPSHCVVCQNFFYQIYATLGSFYIPLFVMIQVRYRLLYIYMGILSKNDTIYESILVYFSCL